MTKRFTYDKPVVAFSKGGINDNVTGETYEFTMDTVLDLLNKLHEENNIKLEIVDAFILGMEDEKGIAPEDKEFQYRMNHTIKILKKLKKDMLNPTEFKRLKELEE